MQLAAVPLSEEIEERQQPADALAQRRSDGRARDAPAEHADEQRVEHHVRRARRHGHREAELRLARRGKQALKCELQHIGRVRDQDEPAVAHTVLQQLALRAEQLRHGPQQHDAEHTERQTGQGRHADDHGKQPVGVFSVALAHRLADEGAAAGAEQEADAAEDHQIRHDEVHGRECGLARKIRDEKAVRHAVDRREDHHHDGRQRHAQQAAVAEVAGKCAVHSCPPSSGSLQRNACR